MKLLMISPYPVFPIDAGGKIRTVRMAGNLASLGMDVTIMTPYRPGVPSGTDRRDGFVCRTIRYPFLIPFLLSGRPLPFWYLVSYHPGMRFLVGDLSSYDIVQFQSPEFAGLVDAVPPDTAIVYDAQNVQYDYVRSECRSDVTKRIAGRRIHQLEEKLLRRSSLVFATCERELERFIDLYHVPASKLRVAPNGITGIVHDLPAAAARPDPKGFSAIADAPRRAVFAGNDVEHNRAAVSFIVDELAPRFTGETSFIVLGSCGKRFRGRTRDNVFFDLGYDRFEEYVDRRTVALHPITQGAGTNLKLINYLAHHLPVVSTEFGVRGFDDLRDYVTICPLERFAEALRNPKPVSGEVDHVLRGYFWSEIALEAKGAYEAILPRPKRRGATARDEAPR